MSNRLSQWGTALMSSPDNSTTIPSTTGLCSAATNNKRKATQFIIATTLDIWSTQQRGREARHKHYYLSQCLGINGFSLLKFWWAGVKAENGFWTKTGKWACRTECLDCHRCQPRSDKVRSKCLESYRSRGLLCGGGVKEGVTKREHHRLYPSLNEAT